MSREDQEKNERSTRIVFFLNILRDGAGMINREAEIAQELASRGYDVSILSYFRPTMHLANDQVKVSSIVPTPYISKLYDTTLAKIFFFPIILFYLWRLKPDVVFTDLYQEARWANRFKKFLGYKVVFTYHGVADSTFYEEQLAQALDKERARSHRELKRADQVVVVSDFLKPEVEGLSSGIERIHNGVNTALFDAKLAFPHRCPRGPTAVFIGRYTEYKGALNVVKAFAQAYQQVPHATLLLFGFKERPEYLEEMQEYIRQHGIEEACLILGPIPGELMPYAVNLGDIFVNGSVDETFCMPLLEAQACGKPCVAFRAGGIPEVVKHESTGLLAEPGSIDEYAAHLTRLLKDESLREKMSAACPKHVEAFHYDKITSQTEKVIDKLISKHAKREETSCV